jgi:hypothetical protein
MRSKRDFAIEATFEIISDFVSQRRDSSQEVFGSTEVLTDDTIDEQSESPTLLLLQLSLSDLLLPSLDSVFFPRDFHR